MKSVRNLGLGMVLLFICYSCHEDLDDVLRPSSNLEIKNFIWRAMNNFYLYKEEVPELADDKFGTQDELDEFLEKFSSPEALFYDGLVAPQDEFSFLVSDYVALEKSLDGINVSNGMQYGLVRYPPTSSNVVGYVRYILPNTSAEAKGIERGNLFNTVDGEQLTLDNFSRLLEPVSYTIGLAEVEEGEIRSTGENVTLTKEEYASNPVFIAKVIETGNSTVGYLMYTAFTGSFDRLLNETFGMFKAEGVTDLVLDLRYNSGGSVESAVDLGSMITGQFDGEVFYTEQWNDEFQEYLLAAQPESLVNRFNSTISTGAAINSLGLSKVYVLTTLRTASASELLINGLNPYIDVVQIGENTRGKFQASITVYDSPDFRRRGANTGHTYAVQPLIYKTVNAAGVTDYFDGLPPDIEQAEDIFNLGILGDVNEPLLQTALDQISGRQQQSTKQRFRRSYEVVGEAGMTDLLYQKMYTQEELPESRNEY